MLVSNRNLLKTRGLFFRGKLLVSGSVDTKTDGLECLEHVFPFLSMHILGISVKKNVVNSIETRQHFSAIVVYSNEVSRFFFNDTT